MTSMQGIKGKGPVIQQGQAGPGTPPQRPRILGTVRMRKATEGLKNAGTKLKKSLSKTQEHQILIDNLLSKINNVVRSLAGEEGSLTQRVVKNIEKILLEINKDEETLISLIGHGQNLNDFKKSLDRVKKDAMDQIGIFKTH